MNLENKKAVEVEFERRDTIRRLLETDEMFAVFAIVKGWTVEKAQEEYARRQSDDCRLVDCCVFYFYKISRHKINRKYSTLHRGG